MRSTSRERNEAASRTFTLCSTSVSAEANSLRVVLILYRPVVQIAEMEAVLNARNDETKQLKVRELPRGGPGGRSIEQSTSKTAVVVLYREERVVAETEEESRESESSVQSPWYRAAYVCTERV